MKLMRVLSACLVAGLLCSAHAASAEESTIRFARQYGFAFMPLVIMEAKGLVEKNVEAAGLPTPNVQWKTFSGGNVTNEALLSGNLDVAAGGIPGFAVLWNKTKGQPYDVIGLASTAAVNSWLITRNPNVKSIKDFGPQDRIAVPAVKASTQAIVLQMAAEKAFGKGEQNRLDELTVTRAHPDALISIATPNGDINSHFSAPPYQQISTRDPNIHKVLDYNEVFGGPFTSVIFYTTKKFRDQNPTTTKAIIQSINEAVAFMKDHKREAAEIYLDRTKEAMTVDELVALMSDPTTSFDTVPQNVYTTISFMYRTGAIQREVTSWKDLFDESLHSLSGS